jgi:hypothetical protein
MLPGMLLSFRKLPRGELENIPRSELNILSLSHSFRRRFWDSIVKLLPRKFYQKKAWGKIDFCDLRENGANFF